MNGLLVTNPDFMIAQVFQFYIRVIKSFLVKLLIHIELERQFLLETQLLTMNKRH